MENQQTKYLVVVCGPTAIGKTALSIDLAKKWDTEIISADSRQFYKEMNIGTAKPSALEMEGIPHHFVDFLSIHEAYSAGNFEKDAISVLDKLFEKRDVCIMAGGSGLYINAVCNGIDELPGADAGLRKKLEDQLESEGIEKLQRHLKRIDPLYYKEADISNPRRLIRAIEVHAATGRPYSSFRMNKSKARPFKIIKIGLNTDREKLYERINKRVDEMINRGLQEEAKKLFPYRKLKALQTVGYRELFDHFEGKTTLEEATDLIRRNTRRYAKRQLTWFGKDADISWFAPTAASAITDFLEKETVSASAGI